MSSELWLGALFSVPIGIGTALVTPLIQRKLDKTSRFRDARQSQRATVEFERVSNFVFNPHYFTQYLLSSLLKGILIGLGVVTALSITFLVQNTFFLIDPIRADDFGHLSIYSVFSFTQPIILIVGCVSLINIFVPALTTWRRVVGFDRYKNSMIAGTSAANNPIA